MNEQLLPAVFVFFIAIMFLLIALYFNFINKEYVLEEDIIKRINSKPKDGHLKNIYTEVVNFKNGEIEPKYKF